MLTALQWGMAVDPKAWAEMTVLDADPSPLANEALARVAAAELRGAWGMVPPWACT